MLRLRQPAAHVVLVYHTPLVQARVARRLEQPVGGCFLAPGPTGPGVRLGPGPRVSVPIWIRAHLGPAPGTIPVQIQQVTFPEV